MKTDRILLGRDAGDVLDAGPAYHCVTLPDGKKLLLWSLSGMAEERDPEETVAELRGKNARLAAKAQAAADEGDWLPMARRKAREQLITAILETFGLVAADELGLIESLEEAEEDDDETD